MSIAGQVDEARQALNDAAGVVGRLALVALLAALCACGGDAATAPSTSAIVAVATTSASSATATSSPTTSIAAVESTTAAPTTVVTVEHAFTVTPCAVEPSEPKRVTCGYLDVPVRHDDPAGPIIQMAVAVVEPARPDVDPDPLLYLAGGPGFGATGMVEQFLREPWIEDRPMVLVDYRGVGSSQPSLACPELDAVAVAQLGRPFGDPAAAEQVSAARLTCRARLVAEGIDLAAYNYTEIAADLADLRVALGYSAWNVYGISNGGRLALELVRRHPEGIRSLVLDAALPPQGNLPGELWPHAQRAFEAMFTGCAADPQCAANYPDLASTFTTLLERLRASPVTVEVDSPAGRVPVVFDDVLLADALRDAMYDSELIPLLPLFLDGLARGNGFESVAQMIVDETIREQSRFSTGMSLSVNCQEEVAFLEPALFEQQAAQSPALSNAIIASRPFAECGEWDVGTADPSIEEPVESDIPALVLVGEYDPVHQRRSADAIDNGLSHATLVEFPGIGHGTIGIRPCPTSLLTPFLDDPTAPIDTSCAEDMDPPDWIVPEQSGREQSG